MIKSVQKKKLKKNYYIEINEYLNMDIHLHVKRKIFSMHFFVKSYLTVNFLRS